MGALVGWLAVGFTAKDGAFTECNGYSRPAFRCDGSPAVGSAPRMTGHPLSTPVRAIISHAAVMDAETGGHVLVAFKLLPPHATVPDEIAPFEFTIAWDTATSYALNADATNMADPEAPLIIGKGSRYGWINGQPMMSGCRLTIRDGVFVPYALVAQRKKATA